MLDDVCAATVATIQFASAWGVSAQEVVEAFPSVLRHCDELAFDSLTEAVTYLALHLPDRYCRVFSVLERLLMLGILPLGRSRGFAAIDIGAGPGPGIFALRGFYAALSCFARQQASDWTIAVLGHAEVVERGIGMSRVMHYFAEHLEMAERGHDPDLMIPDMPARPPSPCVAELAASRIPSGATYVDFGSFDLRGAHALARRRLAWELAEELEVSDAFASRLAQQEPIGVPSAVAIAVMTNFLTKADAVPTFEAAIRRLMAGALVPGGLIVVLGAVGGQYPEIYAELDRLASEAGLAIMPGFEEPMQAGALPEELSQICEITRSIWQQLSATVAPEALEAVMRELRKVGAADIFDEEIRFQLPWFRARIYRRGGRPGKRGRSKARE
ncbi:hypothetical protein [Frankia tisae]|uniref:hypothetical protein n=1 Tax=Frankia tisae TaxID=2950104 RepID=UPI0021BEEF85|nr:hypothetical protein [Frankia tisae]